MSRNVQLQSFLVQAVEKYSYEYETHMSSTIVMKNIIRNIDRTLAGVRLAI